MTLTRTSSLRVSFMPGDIVILDIRYAPERLTRKPLVVFKPFPKIKRVQVIPMVHNPWDQSKCLWIPADELNNLAFDSYLLYQESLTVPSYWIYKVFGRINPSQYRGLERTGPLPIETL